MSSKFIRSFHALANRLRPSIPAVKGGSIVEIKRSSGGYRYVPPSHYDTPLPRNLTDMGYVLTKHWEITPILVTCVVAYGAVVFWFYWAAMHKLECKFQKGGLRIYESMDMCHPTIHKLVTINQEYKPWPELADVLAKMEDTERRNYRIMMGQED